MTTGHDLEQRAILESFESGRRALLQAIAGLSPAQMNEPSVGGWSIKDHLSHLAAWHELRLLDTQRLAAGYVSAVNSTPEQDEVFNQLTVEWRRPLSLDQVIWELEASRARVLDVIRALSPEQLARVLSEPWPLRTGHEAEHAGYIREWRRRHNL